MKKLVTLLLVLAMVFNMTMIAAATEVAEAAEEPATVVRVKEAEITSDSITVETVISADAVNSNLPQLGSATDLTWGVDHGESWDSETQTAFHDPSRDKLIPGMAGFKRAALDQGEYLIELYKEGQEHPVTGFGWNIGSGPANLNVWFDEYFGFSIEESGDYYFTVTAIGDGINYADGPTVRSATWTYVKPAKKLTTPTQLSWDWPDAVFNLVESEAEVFGTYVEFYHTPVLGEEPVWAGASRYYYYTDRTEAYDWMLQNSGLGYYFFKVKIISSDITKTANSDWSAMSPAYNLTELSGGVASELDKIDVPGATPDQIRDGVQALDTEDLKSAMLADKNNTGVVADIAKLEEAVGGAADVEVSAAAAAFDASKVSIVGANLNNAESESDPVTLVLDKPEKEHVLDTLYSSAVAVSFSMDLENVEDTENLEVPVKITLPVPSTINPQFLVILHYHANGRMEEVVPHIYHEGNQIFAEFVLTSFSDFVLTQYAEAEEDGEITPVYRVYNPYTHEHLLTGSLAEKNMLVNSGWSLDGIAWNAPTTGVPVYRLYNPFDDWHTYSISQEEIDTLVPLGWKVDGVVTLSADAKEGTPIYRLFNPYEQKNYHLLTASEDEAEFLTSVGWILEGAAWYGLS